MPEYTPPTPDGFFDQFFGQEEVPPSDFRTLRDIARAYGISVDSARSRIERLERDGIVERRQYTVRSSNGRLSPTNHYGPAKRVEPGH